MHTFGGRLVDLFDVSAARGWHAYTLLACIFCGTAQAGNGTAHADLSAMLDSVKHAHCWHASRTGERHWQRHSSMHLKHAAQESGGAPVPLRRVAARIADVTMVHDQRVRVPVRVRE